MTVMKGVTVNMMKNIPEDTPWDLRYPGSTYNFLVRGVGPVKTNMPISGGMHNTKSRAYFSGSEIEDVTDTSVVFAFLGGGTSSTTVTMTNSSFSISTLYLYDGGGTN